jgi:8-oxo-dGTP diphosphatase
MAEIPTTMLVVAAALERADGRVLMQQRPPGKAHAGLWEFPGGKVEPGETPRAALVREVTEELAITLDPASLAPACFADDAAEDRGLAVVILLYTARAWIGEPRALEGGACDWFTRAEIAALAMPPLDYALLARLP